MLMMVDPRSLPRFSKIERKVYLNNSKTVIVLPARGFEKPELKEEIFVALKEEIIKNWMP